MTKVMYIVRELFRNLYRNPGTALGSLLSLTLLFLLFDLFWIAAGTSQKFYANLVSDIQMDVFLSEDFPDTSIAGLSSEIGQVGGVSSVTYMSKEMARQELASEVGMDLLVGYDSLNPLPRSFVLTFDPAHLNLSSMSKIEDKLAVLPGVTDINYSRNWLEKVERTKQVILRLGLILGAIIFLTAFISSTNNIRLMTRARAVGFRQMLLLGAGRLFIAVPFLIEGFVMAGLAAGLGWLIVFYGRQEITFTQLEVVIPASNDIIAFCVGCGVIGLISGYLGIRKQLKL
jgi:cell division transport system permease protein